MTSENQNISWYQGEDVVITDTVTEGGVAKDIGGATILFVLYDELTDAEEMTKAGAVSGDGSAGVFTVTLTDTETEAMAAQEYYYEIRVTISTTEAVVTSGTATVKTSRSN